MRLAVISSHLRQRCDVGWEELRRHLRQRQQILTVATFLAPAHRRKELLRTDIARAQRNLLGAAYFHALAVFEHLHKLARLDERLMRASVEPRETATHDFHAQPSLAKVSGI